MQRFNWSGLSKPFYCMAPMEGATDAAFRQVVIDCGRPDVCFTEFVNVEGLVSKDKRYVEQALLFEDKEQPLIAQIWGLNPDNFYIAAQEIVDRGFAGVDINMGCPDKAVIKKGTGGALIENRELAKEIIEAVKRGINHRIPVSVKIRIGYKKIVTEEWARFILDQGIEALTVHGRTVAELSKVPNHWDEIGKVVKIKNDMGLKTIIIGNGDVESRSIGDDMAKSWGLDGVMIGRGVFKNPWVFKRSPKSGVISVKSGEERIALLNKHLDLYERLFGKDKPFEPMKRFVKVYIQQFAGAVELRDQLMQAKTMADMRSLLER